MYGTLDASDIWKLDYVNLICGELEGSTPQMAVRGDGFACLSDEDELNHVDSLLCSEYTAKDMGTLGFEDSDAKRLLFLNRMFGV